MDLMNMLQGQLSEGLIDNLTQQLGGADRQQTATAASGIMTTLMGALAKNAATPEGASALDNALANDHDGSILDNISDLIGGNMGDSRAANGAGILQHILGDKQNGAIDMISKMSGLDAGNTGNLMSMLAPILMGQLGQTKQQSGLDAGGISSLLNNSVTTNNSNPTMDLVTRFLDQDGDGSVIDDAANIGMKILGGLFGKK